MHDNEPTSASTIETALKTVIETLLEAYGDGDEELGELAGSISDVGEIVTYEQAGIITSDAGFVLRTRGGEEFQVTIVRSR